MFFWDLDGPILDVSDKYYAVYKDILIENNEKVLSKNEYWNLKRAKTSLYDILSKTNSEQSIIIFKELWLNRIEIHKYQKLDKLQPGITESLKLCKEKNNLVLVTLRRDRQRLLEQLQELNLVDYFEIILSSGQDIKPRWKIKYNLINDYLKSKIANNNFIIGDTETDIIAGNNLGFISIGVLCGIRNSQLIDSKPDIILNQTIDFLEYLK